MKHFIKKIIWIVVLIIIKDASSFGQSLKGLTKNPDTSYTTYSAFLSTRKVHPDIRIVEVGNSGKVNKHKGIVYCSIGNRKLLIDVFSPSHSDKNKRTAIMIIHGGGWRSGSRSQHYPLAEKLAELGYVCFTPEYRLSTEALYPTAIYDLKSALKWIHANAGNYNLDTNKIAVAGFSAGGELAAFLATTIGDRKYDSGTCSNRYSSGFSALIDIDGILSFVHPESGEGDDSKKTSAATYWFGYSKNENQELWTEASPLTHISKKSPPTLFINSGVDRMHAGRDEYRKVLKSFDIYSDVKTFAGAPHSFPLFEPWFTPTVKYIDEFLKKVYEHKKSIVITVSKDGTADFRKVQQAFNSIPTDNQTPYLIFIRNGVYKEKLYLDSTKSNIQIVGEDKFNTILTYDDHARKLAANGDTINTYTSYSFLEEANDVKVKDLSIENSAGYAAGQAVAMHIVGDRVIFENCRFLGNQDVLFAGKANTRQYFKDCYIEGTTDFIFGPSIAWFEKCHINSKRNSHVTAASTPKEQAFGYVFNDCVLTTDSVTVNKVSLGRPWRPYSSVVYINCYLGSHIIPEGWNNWRNPENEKTARYGEYHSYGPGAIPAARFAWTKQLSGEEVKKYTLTNVFRDWLPE
jgi:pectin methylesterase-like acyl-CoA thioesterase/acetyl esterase/lipase